MNTKVVRISWTACVALVVLRIAIGWHLCYEGMWKISTQHSSQPWTAAGYLKNATGPFRTFFRNLTGDPDDLEWLDYERMVQRWEAWYQRFVDHYPGVQDAAPNRTSQALQLRLLLDGPNDYRIELESLPRDVDLSRWKQVIYYDPQAHRLIVTKQHLLPAERDAILELVPIDTDPPRTPSEQDKVLKFRKAVNDLYARQSKLSYKERLAAQLKGDPDRAGIDQRRGDEIVERRMGAIEEYKSLLNRYEEGLKRAKTAYQWDHLQRLWGEIQQKKRELVGPVQALEAELKQAAEALLTEEQLRAGPPPEPWTTLRLVDLQTMWGLTICGGCLMAGLFTRLAALGGGVLLTLFYLAMPPWPGTPPASGPDHTFIINQLFVEAWACYVFITLPSGRWFGLDALYDWWRCNRANTDSNSMQTQGPTSATTSTIPPTPLLTRPS
ncbi:MAG: hypothetical protein KatS3mg113_0823 [Planctomycetaceae bacterium]|nr:MAG: hypothetical protein KatS3mg113_0823 [Planctomycetaceae bacterium]